MSGLSFPRKRESSFSYSILCAILSAIFNLDWYNEFYVDSSKESLLVEHSNRHFSRAAAASFNPSLFDSASVLFLLAILVTPDTSLIDSDFCLFY